MSTIHQTGTQKVYRGEYPDEKPVTIQYQQRTDGWYVKTPENREFWKFTHSPRPGERTVTQLIRKKWCAKYGDPDPLDDRG